MATKPPPYEGTTDTAGTDRYAAESNTMRRMKPSQIVGLLVAIVILALLLWIFLL